MAQLSTELLVRERDLRREQVTQGSVKHALQITGALHFPYWQKPGVCSRLSVMRYSHSSTGMAQEVSGGRVIYGELAAPIAPDEEDSVHLDLTLAVGADWNTIEKWRTEILAKCKRVVRTLDGEGTRGLRPVGLTSDSSPWTYETPGILPPRRC